MQKRIIADPRIPKRTYNTRSATKLHHPYGGEGWNRTNSRGLTAKKELLYRNITKPKFVRRSTIELLPHLASNVATRADGLGRSLVCRQERLTRYIQSYFFLLRS